MPTEGVRILGAEEAQAALGRDDRAAAGASRRDDELEPILAPPTDDAIAERAPRPELDLDAARTASRTTGPAVPDERARRRVPRPPKRRRPSRRSDQPSGEVPPLPHWTEPPTGAVPAIFADADAPDAEEVDAVGTSPVHRRAFGPRAPTGPRPTSPRTSDRRHDERRRARRGERRRRRRGVRTRPRGAPPAHAARPRRAHDGHAPRPRPATARRSPAPADAPSRSPTTARRPRPPGRRQPRPADRDRDRGRGRGRRAHLLHAGHVLDRRCSPSLIVGRRHARVHRRSAGARASVPRRRSRSSVRVLPPARGAHVRHRPRIRCSSR